MMSYSCESWPQVFINTSFIEIQYPQYRKAIIPTAQQLKIYYRKYESLYKKKINKLLALNFNKTCINENLWPTFTIKYICKAYYLFILITVFN